MNCCKIKDWKNVNLAKKRPHYFQGNNGSQNVVQNEQRLAASHSTSDSIYFITVSYTSSTPATTLIIGCYQTSSVFKNSCNCKCNEK